MAQSSQTADQPRPVLAATPARQGRFGRHMFWVLVFGTLLAAIGLFLAWTWKAPSFSADDAKIANDRPKAAAAFDTPAPPPVARQKSPDPSAP